MEDPDRIFAQGGAMEAIQAAKQAGKIRYIGFTGHKDPLVHLRMLEIAATVIRSAIDEGITFMDNCWDYNGGASEIRMGKALISGVYSNRRRNIESLSHSVAG